MTSVSTEVVLNDENKLVGTISFEGLHVHVYRSSMDGRLVVDMDSSDLEEEDAHEDGVPKLMVYCNDARIMDGNLPVELENM